MLLGEGKIEIDFSHSNEVHFTLLSCCLSIRVAKVAKFQDSRGLAWIPCTLQIY